jgi:hypothetical protein
MIYKRSVSPLIATILLIVVSVILVTVVLTWGKSFTDDNLNKTNINYNKSTLSEFIWFDRLVGRNVLIKNLSSNSANIVSYKFILSSDHTLSEYYDKIINFDSPIIINPNSITIIPIECFPDNIFTVSLISDTNEYIYIKINNQILNDYFNCGFVGYWPLNEDNDTVVYDLSNFKNNGNLINGVERVESRFKKVLSFNGTNNYVNLSLPNLFNDINNNDFTIAFWLNSRDLNVYSNWIRVIDITKNSSNYTQFTIPENNSIQFMVTDTGTKIQSKANFVFEKNEWYFLVGTWNANTKKVDIYVNGDLKSVTGSSAGISGANDTFNFGRRSNNAGYYNGLLSDVRIYDRVLTNQEIVELYEFTK